MTFPSCCKQRHSLPSSTPFIHIPTTTSNDDCWCCFDATPTPPLLHPTCNDRGGKGNISKDASKSVIHIPNIPSTHHGLPFLPLNTSLCLHCPHILPLILPPDHIPLASTLWHPHAVLGAPHVVHKIAGEEEVWLAPPIQGIGCAHEGGAPTLVTKVACHVRSVPVTSMTSQHPCLQTSDPPSLHTRHTQSHLQQDILHGKICCHACNCVGGRCTGL